VAKKKVDAAAALVSSMEAFPTAGLDPPAGGAHGNDHYPCPGDGEECWNSSLNGRLEVVAASIHLEVVAASIQLEAAVAATSKGARLWKTLPTAS
jgi:hypothetical protein